MKMMKRTLAVVLTVLTAFGMFSIAGSAQDSAAITAAAAEPGETEAVTVNAGPVDVGDPNDVSLQDLLNTLDAVIADELLDAEQLYYYTDEAILWVADALGYETADADAFMQDVLANGFAYKGEHTNDAVARAITDIRTLMKNDNTDPATLNYVDSSLGYPVEKYHDESKAHVTYTTVPLKVNGSAVNSAAKELDIKAGDRITFGFFLDTDYYVSNMSALIVYDSSLFKVVDSWGEAYDQDTIASMYTEEFLDTSMITREIARHYDVDVLDVTSILTSYPASLQTNARFTSRYKFFYVNVGTKYARNSIVYKFDSDTNGYLFDFTMEAKSDLTYDGRRIAVGAREDWYCNPADRDLKQTTSRAAGYLTDTSAPAGFFQNGSLTKQRSNPASACALADTPYSRFGQTFTSLTEFGADCTHTTWTAGNITKEATCTEKGEQIYICAACGATETREIEALGHAWNDGAVTTEPTCTADGVMTYTCTRCGETRTETIETAGHKYEESVVEATCTTGGYTLQKCSVCGDEIRSDETEALGHDWDEGKITTEPTCTAGGVMTYTCTRCGETRTETIEAAGHKYEESVVEATCTAGGYALQKCSVCGDEIRSDETEALGHDWDEGKITTEPTCTADGAMTYTCTRCGEAMTETIEAAGHKYEESVVEATCTAGGYTLQRCSVCGDEIRSDETDALGHAWNDGEVTKEATCLETGETTYTCTRCGETKTETIEAADHVYEETVVEATCTAGGYTLHKCTVCGNDFISDETAALGHAWDEGEVTKEATCTVSGEITYTCTRCGETRTDTVAALDHAYIETVVEPTCLEGGYTDHKCSRCGNAFITDLTAALGHDWDEGEVTTAPTCTETGVTTYTCTRCAQTRIDTVTALGHDYTETVVEPTCLEGGYTDHKCSRCGNAFITDLTAALGHDWSEGEVTKAPTCTEAGVMTVACLRCGETKTEAVAAVGHNWNEGEVTVAPTCISNGVMTYTCLNDASHVKTEVIDVTPNAHEWNEGEITTAPTCCTEGVMTYVCKNDARHIKTETIAVDPDAHRWDAGKVTKQPTGTTEGVMTYTCLNDQTHTRTVTIAKLPPLLLTASTQPDKAENALTINMKYGRKNRVAFRLTASSASEDFVPASYSSSNTKLVTVDENGNVKFTRMRLCHRTAVITAKSADGRTATCQVTVKMKWWQYIIFFLLFGFLWF